jgi:glycosyltransferase involved in cell wall biosynthesis
MKTAAIYNPYWDTLGGGEKYVATAVAAFLKAKYQPIILWHDSDILDKIQLRFGLNLEGAIVDRDLWDTFQTAKTTEKLKLSSEFDSFFWVSDGSIPLLGSKKNLLHFQVPFTVKVSLLNKIKIKSFDHIICNSRFTKSIIDKNYSCKSNILYPPVTLIDPDIKENVILSVGRFDNILHSKRQDILIEAFKQLDAPDWKLVLAGGSLNTVGQIDSLKKFIGDFAIEIVVNPTFDEIRKLYSQAKVYWHAAGYGSNLKKNPEKAEHFGIATVEAMSAGAIPVVFAGGGQLEIIRDGSDGFFWNKPEELVSITKEIISEKKDNQITAQNAVKTAEKYSQERFIDEFKQYVS